MKDSPDQPFFRPGEPIVETGIYRVFHGDHRMTHEVTLLKGQSFPECRECGRVVHFELVKAVPAIDQNEFRVRLYQLPHPGDESEQETSEESAAS